MLSPALAAVEGSWSTADGAVLSMTVDPSGQLRLAAADGTMLASGSLLVAADGSAISLTFADSTKEIGTLNIGVPTSILWSSGGLGAWTQTRSEQLAKTDEAKAQYAGKTLQDQDFNSEVKIRK